MKDLRLKPMAICRKTEKEKFDILSKLESMSEEEIHALIMKEVGKMYPDTRLLYDVIERIDGKTIISKQDDEGNTVLHKIAWHNHESTLHVSNLLMHVMMLQKENAFIDTINNDGMTALDIALEQESADIAKMLILMGADVMKGKTPPLISALKSNLREIALMLIEKGCDVFAMESNLKTSSLMWAIDKKMSDVAIELIKRGVSVELPNHNGERPLTLACRKDLADIVKELIKAGANPEKVNRGGWLPFQLSRTFIDKRNPELRLKKAEMKHTFHVHQINLAKDMEAKWKENSNMN